MPRTYIGKLFFVILVAVFAFAFWAGFSSEIFFLVVATPVLVFMLFRKKQPMFPLSDFREGTLLAPCHGVVESVRSKVKHPVWGGSLQEISFIVPHFEESGLYFPITGEVRDVLVQEGPPICRYRSFRESGASPATAGRIYRSILVQIKGNSIKVGIHLVKCCFGFLPRPWVFPGDKGMLGANFGFLPLGGSVFMYLPSDVKVLVNVGQKVHGGETAVAVRAEKGKDVT
jgi:hypothetical protein